MVSRRWSRRRFLTTTGAATGAWATGCQGEAGSAQASTATEETSTDPGSSMTDAEPSDTESPSSSSGGDTDTDTEGPERELAGPNILFITADDMGWKSPAVYGNTQLATPALDRLAAEGVLLTRAFNASSSCSSSRATFATGQYIQTHGVNGLVNRFPDVALPPDHPTAATALLDAGYRTGVVGKWHVTLGDPAIHGYEENLNPDERLDWRFADATPVVDFIERHRDSAWYLEVNFLDTHLISDGTYPIEPDFLVDPDAIALPTWWTMPDLPEIRMMAAGYFSQVLKIDSMLGKILDALDDLGLAENTFIVFVSDNGIPWPGNKKTLFDRGTGTPFIARWPKQIPAGRVVEGLASTVDIAPTLLDAAQIPGLPKADGRSILGLLEGRTDDGRAAVFSAIDYHSAYVPTRAVRTDRYKLIRNLDEAPVGLGQLDGFDWAHQVCELPNQPWLLPRVPVEMFDLDADPDEQVNIYDDPELAAVREELAALLRTHMEEVDDDLLHLL